MTDEHIHDDERCCECSEDHCCCVCPCYGDPDIEQAIPTLAEIYTAEPDRIHA